ncbi:MAG TPA: hypothetical protein VHE37_01620 [Nevskiaceae bacterium]|nr:hypothetical protein [Nevskiaceae bacterium]
MIASYLHNFIFVKTKKTAGTSAEIVMSPWVGPADVVTPMDPRDEILRADFGGKPQNFGRNRKAERNYMKVILGEDVAAIRAMRLSSPNRFREHMPARLIREELPDLWKVAYKFTIERHPYDKILSRAWMAIRRRQRDQAGELLSEKIDEVIERGLALNYPMYMAKDKVLVDRIMPYEQMWKEVAALAQRLGKEMPLYLPQAKAQFRRDKRPASEILSAAQKQRIYEKHAIEFELMGYQR